MLARILDDPTFSVLNSLIFFHQVDIVNHLQADDEFLALAVGDRDGRFVGFRFDAVTPRVRP